MLSIGKYCLPMHKGAREASQAQETSEVHQETQEVDSRNIAGAAKKKSSEQLAGADFAELLWNRFLKDLTEAENELSTSILSGFRDIRKELTGYDQEKNKRILCSFFGSEISLLFRKINDALADCRSNALSEKSFHFNVLGSGNKTRHLNEFKEEIKNLVNKGKENSVYPKVDLGKSERERIKLDEDGSLISDLCNTTWYKQLEDLIFLPDDERTNVNEGDCFKVIGICGMGGSVKTTLVSTIFNSKKAQEKFPVRVWVCLSDIVRSRDQNIGIKMVKLILDAIGYDIDHELCEEDSFTLNDLLGILKKKLGSKRYLIVLDGVWNSFQLTAKSQTTSTTSGSNQSRIIVTSRLIKVMREMVLCERDLINLDLEIHEKEMARVCEEIIDSIFSRHQAYDNGTEARQIRRDDFIIKCYNLPLAARTLAIICEELLVPGSTIQPRKKREEEVVDRDN